MRITIKIRIISKIGSQHVKLAILLIPGEPFFLIGFYSPTLQ